jgi:ADP-heptose:LPS heptosyltransferase
MLPLASSLPTSHSSFALLLYAAGMKLPNIQKIAVLRANALGDFIFALPALTAIKQTYPEAELVYLGKSWHKAYLEERNSPVDRVIVVPPSAGVSEPNDYANMPQQLAVFFSAMQQEQFDIAIQLHGGGRYSNPFVKNLGAKHTVGMRTTDAEQLDQTIPYVYYQNEILRYLEVVKLIDAKTDEIMPQIEVTNQDRNEIDPFLPEQPFVVIHAGASDIRRRWPPEKFAAIADALNKQNYRVVLSGTEKESSIVNEVIKYMQTNPTNLCGKISLKAFTGLLAKATLVISNDTGPLHLANAVGAKTVGIFWCANMINGGLPNRDSHRPVISWQTTCPLCQQDCVSIFPFEPKTSCDHLTSFVENITVEEVLEKTKDLLSHNS